MTLATDSLNAVEHILSPLHKWRHHCHSASLAVVNAEVFPVARVARGFCQGVGSQHSWIVVGDDCYDPELTIIDPTLWSYDDDVEGIWVGCLKDDRHTPHGAGSIWKWGRPDHPTGETVELKPREPFSKDAKLFLDVLGPLDEQGWRTLAHAPVEDWPAAEILPAINDTFGPWVPIDIIGMITDRNPCGLYLPGYENE